MKESQVQQSDKDEWRDHVLQEIVDFLSKNKEEIHQALLLDEISWKLAASLIEITPVDLFFVLT